jgi:hypothetical protein
VWSFGADTVITWPVTGLRPTDSGYMLSFADDSEVESRSVVIATASPIAGSTRRGWRL